jgi:hypothetical protein
MTALEKAQALTDYSARPELVLSRTEIKQRLRAIKRFVKAQGWLQKPTRSLFEVQTAYDDAHNHNGNLHDYRLVCIAEGQTDARCPYQWGGDIEKLSDCWKQIVTGCTFDVAVSMNHARPGEYAEWELDTNFGVMIGDKETPAMVRDGAGTWDADGKPKGTWLAVEVG